MVYVFMIAGMSFLPLALHMDFYSKLAGFCVFEWCCGVYFPTWSQLRSAVVPEESRAAIMNLFRIPLNLMVVLMMANVDNLHSTQVSSTTKTFSISRQLITTLHAVGLHHLTHGSFFGVYLHAIPR